MRGNSLPFPVAHAMNSIYITCVTIFLFIIALSDRRKGSSQYAGKPMGSRWSDALQG